MKRLVVLLTTLIVSVAVSAQVTTENGLSGANGQAVTMNKTDWLVSFTSVKIDAAVNVVFRQTGDDEEMRIVYDTKGCKNSKFKFSVNRKGMLVITEKRDSKRTTVTDVIIYYKDLREVKISHAKVVFEDEINATLLDVNVSGDATVLMKLKALDVAVKCTGESRLTLEGYAKYLTMSVSSAKVNCSKISILSATVDCANAAEVRMAIKERLEVKATSNAKMLYYGTPIILRRHNAMFGGEVTKMD